MEKCKDCGDILGSNPLCPSGRCKFVSNGGTEQQFEMEQFRRQRRTLYSIGSDYWRCSTTGRVLQATDYDDKVMCGCGVTNPKILAKSPKTTEVHDGLTVHVKKFLEPATVDDYIEQKDRDEAIKENNARNEASLRPGKIPTRKLYIIRVSGDGVKRWVVFDEDVTLVVHCTGTQRETIEKFLAKRPGPYVYSRYSGSMRPSEMAMTIADFKDSAMKKRKALRG